MLSIYDCVLRKIVFSKIQISFEMKIKMVLVFMLLMPMGIFLSIFSWESMKRRTYRKIWLIYICFLSPDIQSFFIECWKGALVQIRRPSLRDTNSLKTKARNLSNSRKAKEYFGYDYDFFYNNSVQF